MTDKAADDRAPEERTLSDLAIEHLVHLQSGRATDSERERFAAWRRTSPAHERAAREAERLWVDLAATEMAGSHSTAQTKDTSRRRREQARLSPSRVWISPMSRRALIFAGGAAACSIAVVGAGRFGDLSGLLADHATAHGERREILLPDASTVALNSATAISLDYTASARRLLLHRGEALFTVARDATRPFIVTSELGATEAVGTVFAVRREGAQSRVLVVEGAVDVRQHRDPGSSLRLAANQQTTLGSNGLSAPRTVDATAATAWTRGKLVFNATPLAAVAAEIERHHAGRIVILDDGLRELSVSGIFDLGQPDAILRTLELTLDLDMVRLPLLTIIR